MPNSAEDIVDYIMSKDHINLKSAVDDILSSRVQDALEARKEYIGNHMFNPELEEVESDGEE